MEASTGRLRIVTANATGGFFRRSHPPLSVAPAHVGPPTELVEQKRWCSSDVVDGSTAASGATEAPRSRDGVCGSSRGIGRLA